MNKFYSEALKRRVVTEYISENGRSPSKEKLFELLRDEEARRAELDIVGFSSLDLDKPSFGGTSSLASEQMNRSSISDDFTVSQKRIDSAATLLEESFRGAKATAIRINKSFASIERVLNNLLLLKGRADVFTHGVEEGFEGQELVDQEQTTATVEPGSVTLRRAGETRVSLETAKLPFSAISKAGVISARANTPISSLKSPDGSFWEYRVVTAAATGRTSCIIDVVFDEPQYVSEVKITGLALDAGSKVSLNVFYSTDGTAYSTGQSQELAMNSGENRVGIGIDEVKKLRILVSKTHSDYEDAGSHVYLFSFDALEVYSDHYTSDLKSTVFLGPYEVLDDDLSVVNFSMATLSSGTCCTIPDGTQVAFWLSKDGENWYSASCSGDTPSVVSFDNLNPSGSESWIDDSISENSLTDQKILDSDLEFGKEAFTNLYLDSDYADKIVRDNIRVKRNLPNGSDLYGTESGWFYDDRGSEYSCHFYVDSMEGVYMSFGNTSAMVDGRQVTGTTHLAQGYHSFRTSKHNWLGVSEDLTSLDSLKKEDKLYPFNHKLMIEGYGYLNEFAGERIYNGTDSYFGVLCKYVSPERFYAEHDGDLSVYTIEDFDGNLFFKVKTDPSDLSWKQEDVEVEYMLRSSDSNTLYVKAELTTSNTRISPRVHSIKVRVL